VCDCDWAYLQTLETLREPRCRIPRLVDVLQYLAGQNAWLLLDIKVLIAILRSLSVN
jgi:phosphatidylglycerol phospholipase C